MIDLYDVLGVNPDADAEELKKASRKMWLQTHPDKVNAQAASDANATKVSQGTATDRFNEVMIARDVLMDPDRRKIYDTFGFDLGEEKIEQEVWNIGLSTMGGPLGGFLLKTVLVRLTLWLIDFKWIGRSVILGGAISGIMYWKDFTYREINIRSEECLPILVQVGFVNIVVVLLWIWPLLADGVCVAYLVVEVVGPALFIENWKVGVGAGFASLVAARILRGWWRWIIGLEFALAVIILISILICTLIMRLWIDSVQASRGEFIKKWRMSMRADRSRLQKEIMELKREQVPVAAAPSPKAGGNARGNSAPQCGACGKSVSPAEEVKGPRGRSWHATCFCCKACGKSIRGAEWREHAGEPHCHACQSKLANRQAAAARASPANGAGEPVPAVGTS
eukprot:TRINITY_DN50799_c0_g1_i1.p1 TRINITY_DN50799_c0_g1~~TRINITY_DN50799_c0_g1_i1.p1  ORF type:complete len:395 (+),score=80.40 TRINITY_DN50799_c0_g1_i1:121-1305(+)